jgi:hypothetical protein
MLTRSPRRSSRSPLSTATKSPRTPALRRAERAGGALVGVGCKREGPVERTGKKVDQAVDKLKDK